MSITNNQSNILNQNIGIAGCGEMGYPMLKVLLQNDINATGYDIKASENFKDFGNKFVPSKSEFFLKNDVILSIVRDTIETDNLLMNNNELLSKKHVTILICSTLPTTYIAELKKKLPKNFILIDTPMSGSTIKAKEGTLTFMVGGNKNEIEYVMPLLNILGDNVLHIGDFGKGMSVKLLNNFIAASSVLATRNVLAQINDFGLTKKQLLDVVKCSTGNNWFAQNYDDLNWSKENFEKTNTMGILEKDLLSYIKSKSKKKFNPAIDEYENSVVNGIKNIPNVN
jgi:3-hydroxyisobutyrate dehydrogenase-like beta-hydroxyacid dehydrogenase